MKRIDFTNTQVASSQTARDINRGVVLNLIRRRQPISRADLARVSGLQRSTVSLITEQLIRERWVVHGPIGRLPRGRRPRFLRLNDRKAILVADLRPDQTRLGVADVNGNFLSQEMMPTTSDPRATAKGLAKRMLHLMNVHSDLVFEGVGISLPGRVSEKTQHVIFAPNLRWPDFDLKSAIRKDIGLRGGTRKRGERLCSCGGVVRPHREDTRLRGGNGLGRSRHWSFCEWTACPRT